MQLAVMTFVEVIEPVLIVRESTELHWEPHVTDFVTVLVPLTTVNAYTAGAVVVVLGQIEFISTIWLPVPPQVTGITWLLAPVPSVIAPVVVAVGHMEDRFMIV